MEVILILMVCSIFVAGGFLVAYLWSVKSGQYKDLEGDGFRLLNDSELQFSNNKTNK